MQYVRAWPSLSQLFQSTSHLWGTKRLVLCISEPYLAGAYKLAIEGVAEVWKEVNVSSTHEALTCGGYMSHCSSINIHSKKKYKLASIAQIAHRSCGGNRFRESSPMSKATIAEAKKVESLLFMASWCTLSFVRHVEAN